MRRSFQLHVKLSCMIVKNAYTKPYATDSRTASGIKNKLRYDEDR